MKKLVRLFVAATLAAVICALYFYLFAPNQLYVAYRCVTSAESWKDCYSGKPFNFSIKTHGIIYEGNSGDGMDRNLLRYGWYEKQETFFLRDVSKGGVFLDIGANVGFYSLYMARHAKAVHAFEPWEPALKKFRTAVDRNGIRNIVIHPVGLGETREVLSYQEPEGENTGIGSFAFVDKEGAHKQLQIVTGDEALKEAGFYDVELIKMDIEGFERSALRGLQNTLKRSRPIVVFELTVDPKRAVLFKSMEDLVGTFPADYEFMMFTDWDGYTGKYQLGPLAVNFDNHFQYNVVAFPAEKKGSIPLKGPVKA